MKSGDKLMDMRSNLGQVFERGMDADEKKNTDNSRRLRNKRDEVEVGKAQVRKSGRNCSVHRGVETH